MYILLPLIVLLGFLGLSALAEEFARAESQSEASLSAGAAAINFLAYRNAVVEYLESQRGVPTSTGSVPETTIAAYLPTGYSGSSIPSGTGNYVVVGTGEIRTAYIFGQMQSGELAALGDEYEGDASFGSVSGGVWTSIAGGSAVAVPDNITDGDIMSVVQVGD